MEDYSAAFQLKQSNCRAVTYIHNKNVKVYAPKTSTVKLYGGCPLIWEDIGMFVDGTFGCNYLLVYQTSKEWVALPQMRHADQKLTVPSPDEIVMMSEREWRALLRTVNSPKNLPVADLNEQPLEVPMTERTKVSKGDMIDCIIIQEEGLDEDDHDEEIPNALQDMMSMISEIHTAVVNPWGGKTLQELLLIRENLDREISLRQNQVKPQPPPVVGVPRTSQSVKEQVYPAEAS